MPSSKPSAPNEELQGVEVYEPPYGNGKATWTGDTERGIRHRVRKQTIKVRGGMSETWEEHEVFWETPHRRVKDVV